MKRPSFQFYPGDWLRDSALRVCSLAARGLWIEMLCFMHQGTPYGRLALPSSNEMDDGKDAPEGSRKDLLRPILAPALARITGGSPKEVQTLLNELEAAGVFSRTGEQVIYSRRMVRDEKLREIRAAGGELSQKNPNVPRRKDVVKDHAVPSLQVSPSSSSSFSFASSSPTKDIQHRAAEAAPLGSVSGRFMASWNTNCGSLPRIKRMTKERLAKLAGRMRANPNFEKDFVEGVRKAAASPFLRGESDRGWKCTFDWLLENDTNLIRVLEGAFDGGASKRPGNGLRSDRDLNRFMQDLPGAVIDRGEEQAR